MYEFRWNRWNVEHIGAHGVSVRDAEWVVNNAKSPYPRYVGDDRYLVIGQATAGDYLQVVYIFDPPGIVFVIHARPLTPQEKRRYRRGR